MFVMTNSTDTVEVEIKSESGDFAITIGAIPHEIGQKIDEANMRQMRVFKALKSGDADEIEDCSVNARKWQKEVKTLLCKYGIRGHKGLFYADGSEIPCKMDTEEGTKYTTLSPETLELYLSNEQFLNLTGDKVLQLRQVGIGRYKAEGEKSLEKINEGRQNVPLASLLEKLFNTSTK